MKITKELLDELEGYIFDDSYYINNFEKDKGITWEEIRARILYLESKEKL